MSKGKLAGHVAHAAIEAADNTRYYRDDWYSEWLCGNPSQTKIILKVSSESELRDLRDKAEAEAGF